MFKSLFNKHKLSKKLTILLSFVFLVGILLSGVTLANLLYHRAQDQVRSEAQVLLKVMNSVRMYTNTQVSPELEERSGEEFLPQRIPSFAVREVFEILRQDDDWNEFFFKDATLNPTNPRDKADKFETAIVKQFQQNTNLKKLDGFRPAPSGELFYLARPFAITQESCLQCHSTPERAPAGMIRIYGAKNGFGWQLNKIMGIQIVYVPAARIMRTALQFLLTILGIVGAIFAVAIFLVNYWLNRYVVRPLKRMTSVAQAVSTGDMEAEFAPPSEDEVGALAIAFTRMKTSLALAIKRLERHRNS